MLKFLNVNNDFKNLLYDQLNTYKNDNVFIPTIYYVKNYNLTKKLICEFCNQNSIFYIESDTNKEAPFFPLTPFLKIANFLVKTNLNINYLQTNKINHLFQFCNKCNLSYNIFDILLSFYGFKRYDTEFKILNETFEQLYNILSNAINFKLTFFIINDALFIDKYSIEFINFINKQNKNIVFIFLSNIYSHFKKTNLNKLQHLNIVINDYYQDHLFKKTFLFSSLDNISYDLKTNDIDLNNLNLNVIKSQPILIVYKLVIYKLLKHDLIFLIELLDYLCEILCKSGLHSFSYLLIKSIELFIINKKIDNNIIILKLKILRVKIAILQKKLKLAYNILQNIVNKLNCKNIQLKDEDYKSIIYETNKFLGYILILNSDIDNKKAIDYLLNALNIKLYNLSYAEISNLIGIYYYNKNEFDKSLAFFKDSIRQLSLNNSNQWLILDSAYRGISTLYLRLGEFKKALIYLKKCEELCIKNNSLKILSNTYHYLGMLYHERGEYQNAILNFKKAIEISDKINDYIAKSRVWTSLGVTYFNLAKYKKALEIFNKSLEIAISTKNEKSQAILKGNMARIYALFNNFPLAFQLLNEDIEILLKTNNLYGLAYAYTYLGEIYSMSNDNENAYNYFLKALEIAKKCNFLKVLIISSYNIISISTYNILNDKVKKIINELIYINDENIDEVLKSIILKARCIYETSLGNYHRATCFINQALINFEKMEMPLETALCLIDEANILKLNGLSDMANSKISKALEIFNNIEAIYYLNKYGSINNYIN